MRLDYRISCLLSTFRREFDESGPAAASAAGATLVPKSGVVIEAPKVAVNNRINLNSISLKAESIFDKDTSSIGDVANFDENSVVDLDLDGQGGKTSTIVKFIVTRANFSKKSIAHRKNIYESPYAVGYERRLSAVGIRCASSAIPSFQPASGSAASFPTSPASRLRQGC